MWNPQSQIFNAQLLPNERILWQGRPRQGVFLRASDAFVIPFSLFWCGFAIFWVAMTVMMGAPIYFSLFGLPFIAAGIYLVIGRFFYEAWQRGKTHYAVTNKRILILSMTSGTNIKSIDLKTLPPISLNETRSGRGTIAFGDPVSDLSPAFKKRQVIQPPSFDSIENARNVFQIITSAQQTN